MEKKVQSSSKKYRAIDLFAGIGGIRLGFQNSFGKKGIQFVFSNEIDDNSCKTYEKNFGENPKGDITKIEPSSIPDFDILLAGFPCQAFSLAGYRKGFEDIRGTMFYYVARIIQEKHPDVFLLENVKHLINHNHGKTFQIIKDILMYDLHYSISYKVLNAKDFGVPQNRERVYIIGFRENLMFDFPSAINKDIKIEDILDKEVDDWYYLSHEYLSGLKKHRARHEALGHGFGYQVVSRDSIANAVVCGGMGRERNLILDKILPNCWKKEGDNIRLRNNEGIRSLTEREWARLQGFPESFVFPVTRSKIYRQLGNSVAVPVIQAIAEQIKKTLENPIKKIKIEITEEEQIYHDFLIMALKNKILNKSGRKNIDSMKKYIISHCFRITDLDRFSDFLLQTQIMEKKTHKQYFFSSKLLRIKDMDNISDFIINSFKNMHNLKLIDNFFIQKTENTKETS